MVNVLEDEVGIAHLTKTQVGNHLPKSPWTKLSENDFRHRRRYHHHWEGASSSSPTSS